MSHQEYDLCDYEREQNELGKDYEPNELEYELWLEDKNKN